MTPTTPHTPTTTEWATLVSRVAALEARDADLAGQIGALRDDLRRIESRLYAVVATGIMAGSTVSSLVSHFGG